MIEAAATVKLFKFINIAIEGASAWNSIQSSLYALQQKRLAEGRSITEADLDSLMAEGDVKAAAESATLLAALLAKKASLA